MFTLILTTIIFVYDGQAEGEDFTEVRSVRTETIAGFESRAACETAAENFGGTVLNAERQALCVAMAGE